MHVEDIYTIFNSVMQGMTKCHTTIQIKIKEAVITGFQRNTRLFGNNATFSYKEKLYNYLANKRRITTFALSACASSVRSLIFL